MARRRTSEQHTPTELLHFRPEEWAALGDDGWGPCFGRWAVAREAWEAEHPGVVLPSKLAAFRDQVRGDLEC